MPISGERSMAMTEYLEATGKKKPYRNGPGGHREAAADIVIMMGVADKKKKKSPKKKK